MKVPEQLRPEYPNFLCLRIIAASAVIFTHSFFIADGNGSREPVARLLGEPSSLGFYAVFIFFMISGFLITASAREGRSVLSYALKRIFRIYPALIACAFVSSAIIGPMFTTLSMREYWGRLIPFLYTARIILPGNNGWQVPTVSFPSVVPGQLNVGMNGSLWTIPQEINCYVIFGILMAFSLVRWQAVLALGIAVIGFFFADSFLDVMRFVSRLSDFTVLFPSFVAGSLMFFVHRRWGLDGRIAAAFLLPLLLSACLGVLLYCFVLAAYPVLWLATSRRVRLPTFERIGDISYGMYLYGWPMGQLTRSLLGDAANPWPVFAISWLLSAALGYISWHLLEKRMLALVPRIRAGLVSLRPKHAQ